MVLSVAHWCAQLVHDIGRTAVEGQRLRVRMGIQNYQERINERIGFKPDPSISTISVSVCTACIQDQHCPCLCNMTSGQASRENPDQHPSTLLSAE